LETLIKSGQYNEALEFASKKLDYLTKKELKLLKRLLLFCAVDFINTYKNSNYANNMNNPFFMKNDKLNLIKVILDSNIDIFYYLYLHINDDKYIEEELKNYQNYFKDIIFIKKDLFYQESNLNNKLQSDGIIQVQDIFKKDDIEKLKKIVLDYFDKTELSEFFYNENRSRIYLREENNSDILGIFKNLVDSKKIEKLLKKHINIDVECNYMQLEYMKSSPVQTDKMKHWHIDNLSDQFKVFIPLVDVDTNNAPLNYIPKTHLVKNIGSEMKKYWHYIYRMSGVAIRPTTGLPNYMVENLKSIPQKGVIKVGDIAIFNTTLVHSGEFVKSNNYRLNIVLVFHNINTNRNILFKQLKTFY